MEVCPALSPVYSPDPSLGGSSRQYAPFLTMRLGTLAHNITLLSKPYLQVCKQQQTASGIKNLFKLILAFLAVTLGALVHHIALIVTNEQPQGIL